MLESSGDEGIGEMLCPSPVELDAAGDAGRGGVEGLPPGWLGVAGQGVDHWQLCSHTARLLWGSPGMAAVGMTVLPGGAGAGLSCSGPLLAIWRP